MKQQILISLSTDELRNLIDESVSNAMQAVIGNTISDDKEIMDLKEVAAFLKVSRHTIYRKTHKREIPHYKKGGKLYFKRIEIEEYRDSGKQITQEEFDQEARKKLRKT
jgi:excisionase family DNA binding protein